MQDVYRENCLFGLLVGWFVGEARWKDWVERLGGETGWKD